jgi:hypothetical protein
METDLKDGNESSPTHNKKVEKDLPSFPHVHTSPEFIQGRGTINKLADDPKLDAVLKKNDGEKNPQQHPSHEGSGDAFSETEKVAGQEDDSDINDFTLYTKD